jgi:putative nucleotidyltransferase with HDIG domain
MMTLEDQIKSCFLELKIDNTVETKVENYLKNVKSYHAPTYYHSLRVALLARKIAEFTHIDSKDIFIAALLHDIGKTSIDSILLNKETKFDKIEMEIIKKHVNYGYNIIKEEFPVVSEIMRRHHLYQENSYPLIADDDFGVLPVNSSLQTSIMWNSRLLALADFYDALTTRNNNLFYGNRTPLDNEYLQIMIKNNLDQEKLIKDLSLAGILKGFYKEIKNDIASVDRDELQNKLYANISWSNKYSPNEIARNVMLACALEPLGNKYGCTTRYIDEHPCIKLEYFTTAAINIGDSFQELSQRILSHNYDNTFPVIYDLAYKAQCDAKKNHAGGRMNQGIIELLIPIVTAQMRFKYEGNDYCENTLRLSKQILTETSEEDVNYLVKLKRFAFDLCGYSTREVQLHSSSSNIFEYYYNDMISSPINSTTYLHNFEFVNGFPTVKKIYNLILNDSSKTLMQKTENAYSEIRLKEHKNVGVGLTADYIAAALYLLLSSNQKEIFIK